MRTTLIFIGILAILFFNPASCYAAGKSDVKTIGVFVCGARGDMLADRADKLLNKKLFSYGKAPFFGGAIEVVNDGEHPLKQANQRYSGYNLLFTKAVSLVLEDMGYRVVSLNDKKRIIESYSSKRISELIDIAKEENSDIDACLFFFYTVDYSRSEGNVVFMGLFLDAKLAMYATDAARTTLWNDNIAASHFDLSGSQVMKDEKTGLFGFKSTEKTFSPSDVAEIFLEKMLTDMKGGLTTRGRAFNVTLRSVLPSEQSAMINSAGKIGGEEKAYMLGEIGATSVKGYAKEFWDLADIGSNGRIEFELNLKSGDLIMPMDVMNISEFFSQKNMEKYNDIQNLKATIVNGIGSVSLLHSLRIMVLITNKTGRIIDSIAAVDPSQIQNGELRNRLKDYMDNNFDGAFNAGKIRVILDISPRTKDFDIRGVSLGLDKKNVNSIIASLKAKSGNIQKTGSQIEKLIKLANGESDKFEDISLVTNENGKVEIRAKIRSKTLQNMPGIMSELKTDKNHFFSDRLNRRTIVELVIDAADVYNLDVDLKLVKYKSIIAQMSDAFLR